MSEFDINLIRAFSKCPAFYDKRNPNFKDRIFTENAWKELSLQLGFDDKILRDRMFQLRNRYNLEKRKVEMMVQDGETDAKSTWPLFEYMTFLDGHIRPRKSYKSIMNRSVDVNPHSSQHQHIGHHHQNHHMNSNNSVLMPRHSTNFRNYNPISMALQRGMSSRHHHHQQQQMQQQQQAYYNLPGMLQDSHQALVDCEIDLSGTLASNGIVDNHVNSGGLNDDKSNPFYPNTNGMNGVDSQMMPSTSYEASENTSDIKMELFSDSDDDEGNETTNDDDENLNNSSNQNNTNNNGNNATNNGGGQQGQQQAEEGGSSNRDENNEEDDVHFINPVDLLAMEDEDSTNCDKLERSHSSNNNDCNDINGGNGGGNSSNNNNHYGSNNGGGGGGSSNNVTTGNNAEERAAEAAEANKIAQDLLSQVLPSTRSSSSLKSMQNNSQQSPTFNLNLRHMEALKRTAAAAAAAAVSGQDHQQSSSNQMHHHSSAMNFKRRRRNYHQMVVNGVNNPHFAEMGSSSSTSHHHHQQQQHHHLAQSLRPQRPNSMLPPTTQQQLAMLAMNGLPNQYHPNPMAQQHQQQQNQSHNHPSSSSSMFHNNNHQPNCANNSNNNNNNNTTDKYSAFGQFVASSLQDLPELKSLDIVAKFTSHLIHALRDHKTEQAAAPDSGGGGGGGGSGSTDQKPTRNF